jgi:hypothetical protein
LSAVRDVLQRYRVLEESGGQLSAEDQILNSNLQDEERQLVTFISDAKATIESLTASPVVMDKLQDAAGEEDRERTAKERLAELEREYLPRFEHLADEAWEQIDRLINEVPASIARHEREQKNIRAKLGSLVDQASSVSPLIEQTLRYWDGVTRESLQALKRQFGVFKSKERKAVDQLLAHANEFAEFNSAARAIGELRGQRWEIASSAKETFFPRFKALADEAQQRAGERGIPEQLFYRSALDLFRIGRAMEQRIFPKLQALGPDGKLLADRQEYEEAKRISDRRFSHDRIESMLEFVRGMTTGHR